MGVFNLLCSCCLGRPKRHKESLVEYSYVTSGPLVNEVVDTSIKARVIESSQPATETTPPPHYSVNSVSKVQTIVSSAPTNPGPIPSATGTKEEKSEAISRAIKPLPQRHDKRSSGVEQKSLLQTPLPPSLYEKSAEPVVQGVKEEEAASSKPVQLFIFPKPNANIESNAAMASSSTTTTTTATITTKTTTTEMAAAATAPVAKSAAITTIFDRLAASNPRPVPAATPVIPTPVSNPAPISNPTPAPSPHPIPIPPKGNSYLDLALRPATPIPNTPTSTAVPLSTPKPIISRLSPPKTATITTTTTTTTTTPPPPPPPPPAPASPGTLCPTCFSPNKLLTTQAHNLNHLRPYRLCSNPSCRAWNGFTDTRGLDPLQQCDCTPSYPMRLVAMNKTDTWGRRQAFWSCQYKACSAWGVCLDEGAEDGEEEEKWFSSSEVKGMVREGRI